MACTLASYAQVRDKMLPGDVIAFGGKTGVSHIVKMLTSSEVSHVGVILQTKATFEPADSGRVFNLIVESTRFDNFVGVDAIRLSDRLKSYHGQVWWLPLNRALREGVPFNALAFFDFLYAQKGKPFDLKQAWLAALDGLDELLGQYSPTLAQEDFGAFFCSELVAAGLEVSGLVGSINASEVTPIELCRWNIFEPEYHQLYWETPPPQEEQKPISDYNSRPPRQSAPA